MLNLVTFSTLVIFAALAATCFMFGWVARRVLSNRREADLQRNVYEAKGALPQLESTLRNREARINTLQTEAQALRERLTVAEAAQSQKDAEIVKRDREIRLVRSELQIVKDGTVEAEATPFDEIESEEAASGDPQHTAAMKRLEGRYESLKKGLISRDDRIAELEAQLSGGKGKAAAIALELEHAKLEESSKSLESTLATRDALINDLQARLTQETEQRELLEALAKRRGDANRGLKDTAAKLEVQLPKMTESLNARNAVIAERDASIAALRGELAQMRNDNAAQARSILDLEATVAARRDEIARQTTAMETLKHQQAAQVETLKHQQLAQLETLKHQQSSHAETLKHQHATQLETAKQKAVQLELRVNALTTELTLAQQTLTHAQTQLQERDGALSEQELRVQAADTKMREHGNTQSSLTKALRDRDFTIESLSADVTRLNTELARALAAPASPAIDAEASMSAAAEAIAVPTLTDIPAPAQDEASHPAELQFAAIHEHAARTERELHDAVREMKTLSGRVAELEAKRTSLEALLRDKDASLTERARRIEDQQDQLARLEARIDERNQEIANLKRARDERPATPPRPITH
jgi:chromosome segregation ATPase